MLRLHPLNVFAMTTSFRFSFTKTPLSRSVVVLTLCLSIAAVSVWILDTRSTNHTNSNNNAVANSLSKINTTTADQLVPRAYEILTERNQSWSAINIRNNVQVNFFKHELQLRSTENINKWRLNFKLVAADNLQDPLDASKPSVAIKYNKIEFKQSRFSEWYINTRQGIEHGYTINSLIDNTKQQISLDIKVSGNFTVNDNAINNNAINNNSINNNAINKKGEIHFLSPQGLLISTYSHLKVFDADNKPLLASLTYHNELIKINVDTTTARFPITIDPIVSFPATLVGPNLPGTEMGIDVDGVGDLNGDGIEDVVVGMHGHNNSNGAIQVYLGSDNGVVTPPIGQNWFIQKNAVRAQFGNAVSGVGDIDQDGYADIVVGSYVYSVTQAGNPSASEEGAIYVFYGSPTGLVREQLIIGDQAGGHLGHSVGNVGDVNNDGFNDVIASAASYSGLQATSGRVYVYFGSATGLQPDPWFAEVDQANILFGASVNGAGDINGDNFDDILVGAPYYNYTSNGGTTITNMGMVFLYLGSQTLVGGASSTAPILLVDQTLSSNAQAGVSVDGAGDINQDGFPDIIVGSHTYTSSNAGSVLRSGAVLLYFGPFAGPGAPSSFPLARSLGDQLDGEFGYSVTGAGDINADGFPDVATSAFQYDSDASNNNEGLIIISYGSPTGLRSDNISLGYSNPLQANSKFGISIRAAGDINNDGYNDVIVGANYFDGPTARQGRAFIFEGRGESDISVSLVDNIDPALPTSQVIYTATVINNGPDPAKRLVLASTLPQGATFVSASGMNWSCDTTVTAANNIICNRANLDPTAISSVEITVTLVEGMHTLSTDLSANIIDPNSINNSDSEITIVAGVTPQNRVPVANNSSLDIFEDSGSSSHQLSASDDDADPLSYEITLNPTLGLLSVNSNGLFTYSTIADNNGADFFKFRVFDGTAYSNPATVSINIAAVQDIPVANNDTYSIDEDVTVNRLLQFFDPDLQDKMTFLIKTQPSLGSLTIIDGATGAYNYEPQLNVSGDDFFTFTVSDGTATSNEARVDIAITAINDAPEVEDLLINAKVGQASSNTVVGKDIEASPLTFSVTTPPTEGDLSFDATSGNFTYTAYPDSSGVDSFQFTASDNDKTSAPGKVTIVLSTNQAPDKVELVSPSNGDTLTSTPAILKWKPTQDPDGDEVYYEVIFCENQDFVGCTPTVVSMNQQRESLYATMLALGGPGTGIILLSLTFPGQRRRMKFLILTIAVGVVLLSCSDAADQVGDNQKLPIDSNFSFVINSLNSNTLYYWKVISSDKAMSTESDIWNFSIEK